MANNNLLNMLASKAEESKNEQSNKLFINTLVPYSAHPFSLYEGERLDDMVESIKANGVLLPIIVRPIENEDNYEILSGHNRVNAAKIAGLVEVPAIIKSDLTDDEAKLIVTETNLIQRSFGDLKHSERAYALKTHLEALKNKGGGQGRRNDLIKMINEVANPDYDWNNETSSQVGTMSRTNELTGQKYGLSKNSVARYVRLSNLIKPLLNRVDDDELALLSGVELSYLSETEQQALETVLETGVRINLKQAKELHAMSDLSHKELDEEEITEFLNGEKIIRKPKAPPPIKIKHKVYSKHFADSTPVKEMEKIIDKALTEYFLNHKNEMPNG